MEMKSRITLPLDKRSKATAKELLKSLEDAEAQLEEVFKSPYFDTYITLLYQVADWNSQLKIGGTETKTSEDGVQYRIQKGKIDLFADKDNKEFERCFKYFSDILPILNALDEMRKKLTPDELKAVEATSEIDDARENIKAKLNGNSNK